MLARPVLIDSSAYVAIKVHFYISQYLSSHIKNQNCLAFVLINILAFSLIKTHGCATIYLDVNCAFQIWLNESTNLLKHMWSTADIVTKLLR